MYKERRYRGLLIDKQKVPLDNRTNVPGTDSSRNKAAGEKSGTKIPKGVIVMAEEVTLDNAIVKTGSPHGMILPSLGLKIREADRVLLVRGDWRLEAVWYFRSPRPRRLPIIPGTHKARGSLHVPAGPLEQTHGMLEVVCVFGCVYTLLLMVLISTDLSALLHSDCALDSSHTNSNTVMRYNTRL